jgi:predicted small integral membrane protein
MSWMAWTVQGAVLFGVIIAALIGLAIWEIRSPTIERRGFLPMPTTRGDRFFVGLLATAFIHMAWLGFTSITPWVALGISLAVMAVIGRWG